MKKIVSIVLALLLVMSLSTAALAAEGETGDAGETPAGEVKNQDASFTKTYKITNEGISNPEETFTFTFTADHVTDSNKNLTTAQMPAIPASTIKFDEGTATVAGLGKTVAVVLEKVEWPGVGVYYYTVKETKAFDGGIVENSTHEKKRCIPPMRRILRTFLALAACGALVFGSVNLVRYIRETKQSISLKENLIEQAVVVKSPEASPAEETAAPEPETETGSKPQEDRRPRETAPIGVDFHVLAAVNEDIIGWLYSPGTPINLPVVQGDDNEYYLDRMVDGTVNGAGTLFADFRNAAGFADYNTVIYGHNMKNKEIFGTLADYKVPSYYDEHPLMWLLTPDGDYKVELVAGFITPAASEIYSFDQTAEGVLASVRQAMEESTFVSDVEIAEGDRFLTLSTCSYEYENARYVLIGKLTELK